MQHKIKLQDLPNIINNLNIISEKDIPIKLSYKLSKLYKQLSDELTQYQELNTKIINKYGMKDENDNLIINEKDNTIPILPDKINEFQKETMELQNIEITIDFIWFIQDMTTGFIPKYFIGKGFGSG